VVEPPKLLERGRVDVSMLVHYEYRSPLMAGSESRNAAPCIEQFAPRVIDQAIANRDSIRFAGSVVQVRHTGKSHRATRPLLTDVFRLDTSSLERILANKQGWNIIGRSVLMCAIGSVLIVVARVVVTLVAAM